MKRLHYIFITLTIIWMAVIFIFSSQTGETSSNTSGGIVDIIVDIFIPDFSEYSNDTQLKITDTVSLIIRKGAHFTEYAILGFLWLFTFVSGVLKKTSDKKDYFYIFKNMHSKILLYSGFSSCIYAISDELHQGFVADRSPAVLDVFIDTAGGFTGAFVACLLLHIKLKKRKDSV